MNVVRGSRLALSCSSSYDVQRELVMGGDQDEESVQAPDQGARAADPTGASCVLDEPGIVLVVAAPDGSVPFEHALELADDAQRLAFVLDLSRLRTRPRGAFLHGLRRALQRPVHVAVVEPSNGLMRFVTGFLFGRVLARASTHAARDAAIEAARKALAEST
jgi:hypothetical protein